ncbi:MAG: hypothetical protein V7774_08160 [Pseudorhizobium pelagicum]|uniref:hypothetical protein n=1 Tax=Pseudorhizobium pelagicum TaxID=1509405 RepID=UPI00345F6946
MSRVTGDASEGKAPTTDADEILSRFPALAVHQFYGAGSTSAELVRMLNECILAGHMPRSRDKARINRRHFADKLGLSIARVGQLHRILAAYEEILEGVEPIVSLAEGAGSGASDADSQAMDAHALEVVARYPTLLRHQYYPRNSKPSKIAQILNAQICNAGLKRSRGGKISRQVITTQLGLSRTATTGYIQIFHDYEEATGGTESAHEARIPAMRQWFQEQTEAGTLLTRDGKASRIQFYNAFDLPQSKTLLIRYPRIAALVEEYDEKIRATGYQPGGIALTIEKLKAILAEDPPVGKNGRTINRRVIGEMLGINEHNISRAPYAEVLEAADKALVTSLETDPLVAFVGGRVFRFKVFTEQGWPNAYAIRVRNCFQRNYRTKNKDDAKTYFYALVDLMAFIASGPSSYCRSLFHGLGNGVPAKSLETEFTRATQEYRERLRELNAHIETCNAKINTTNTIIRKFSGDAVLPHLGLYLIGFRNDNPTHLQSFAEASPAGTKRSNPHVDGYLAFATSMLKHAAELRSVEIAASEQGDFARALRSELEAEPFTAADNPATLILRILDRRIERIRAAAWDIVRRGQRDLEHGRSLLERAEELGHDFDRIIDDEMNRFERNDLLRHYFPVGEDMERGIANLLLVVSERYRGIYPSNKSTKSQFFQKRALEYGGARKLQAYLMPSQEVVSAILTLYLLESGSNVSVGRTLHLDCIEATDTTGHSMVTGYKARAAGKPIFAVMSNECEAILAMKWLQEAVASLPSVEPGARGLLFVSKTMGDKIKVIEEFTYRADFKRLIAAIPDLGGLSMTPNMTRPSILLRAALEQDGRTNLSQAIGQHGKRVHEGYVNKYPLRYLRDTEVRHFQHSLETVIIEKIKEAHEFLGIDADGMSRRVEAVMKTGLGTLCGNRNARLGSDGSPCKSMDCWNDCPQLIVIARKEEIAILQIWQHSLRLVEGDWIQHQPERWEAVWLPWLCFVDAVEVKMRQSFGTVWRSASEISDQIINHPKFQPMRLF